MTGSGNYGSGYGSGSGYGYGDGNGDGYGYGNGDGSGDGSGDGYGSGYGNGYGYGNGDGDGCGDNGASDFKKKGECHMTTRTKKTTKPVASKLYPVLITTLHRGVFFAYVSSKKGKNLQVRKCRNVVYWTSDSRGFLGLASRGPLAGSKVGPASDGELRDVTSVFDCTPDAVAAFEAAPWG